MVEVPKHLAVLGYPPNEDGWPKEEVLEHLLGPCVGGSPVAAAVRMRWGQPASRQP